MRFPSTFSLAFVLGVSVAVAAPNTDPTGISKTRLECQRFPGGKLPSSVRSAKVHSPLHVFQMAVCRDRSPEVKKFIDRLLANLDYADFYDFTPVPRPPQGPFAEFTKVREINAANTPARIGDLLHRSDEELLVKYPLLYAVKHDHDYVPLALHAQLKDSQSEPNNHYLTSVALAKLVTQMGYDAAVEYGKYEAQAHMEEVGLKTFNLKAGEYSPYFPAVFRSITNPKVIEQEKKARTEWELHQTQPASRSYAMKAY
ncbi:hypothetical protein H4R33_002786 [Dimargaris cristalligena]|nr:hypothetical protein H4R33_002786 [Dimargaris cristalligena]